MPPPPSRIPTAALTVGIPPRIATRARPAVGTLLAAAASPRGPGHPAAVAPLPAAGAARARDAASPDGLLWRVANPGPRAAGAIAPFTGLGAPPSPAMSRAVCVDSAFALARAVGGPPGRPSRSVWVRGGPRGLLLESVPIDPFQLQFLLLGRLDTGTAVAGADQAACPSRLERALHAPPVQLHAAVL